MKRFSALILAICFTLGSFASASALEVKAKGTWEIAYGFFQNWNIYSDPPKGSKASRELDRFQPRMRIRPLVEFIASDDLKAVLHLEATTTNFGRVDSGYDIDADNKTFVIKSAFLDWNIPETNTHIRMGMQPMALGSMAFRTNFVFTTDVAGISIDQKLTDNASLTAFWARAYDSSYGTTGQTSGKNNMDEMDLFGLILPFKSDVIRINPFAMLAVVGKDSDYYITGARNQIDRARPTPLAARMDSATIWWLGTTFELPVIDPFVFKFDAMYGAMDGKEYQGVDYSQRGYFLGGQFGYKFDWGQLSMKGWYGSGDNNDKDGRYGTIPVVSTDEGFKLGIDAFKGNRFTTPNSLINSTGAGTWGIGIDFDKMNFVSSLPKLTHNLLAYVYRGTNKGDRVESDDLLYVANGDGGHKAYMLSSDTGFGATFATEYRFPNLLVALDFGYNRLWLSKQRADRDTDDMYSATLAFRYSF